jgi:stage IV sporulation protein A
MERNDIYRDIAVRTNGDIYIGVVGPVRTGKSTFISKFMEIMVLPYMSGVHVKGRAVDEMPQSADGKTIMTTQPRFVPAEAVKIKMKNHVDVSVRLIDCVGYLVDGAGGHMENNAPRMVKTPWSDREMPFEQAAELGTHKVIADHSTIGILVTSDGSITEIPRASYVAGEERVASELKALRKPFVIVLNSKNPASPGTQKLRAALEDKYGAAVIALSVASMTEEDIEGLLERILLEFPVVNIEIDIPKWMRTLPFENPMIQNMLAEIRGASAGINKMRDFNKLEIIFGDQHGEFRHPKMSQIVMGSGSIVYEIKAKPDLFYKVLSEQCKCDISDDFCLMSYIREVAASKNQFDRIKSALEDVDKKGYGIVNPPMEALELAEPQLVKQGNRFGVRLRASAPSLHIMKVDVSTEVCPTVGTEQESQFMLKEFETNPKGIWETNMFGKSLNILAKESISNKIYNMPQETQSKMRRTVGKIVNEGRGGVICILL